MNIIRLRECEEQGDIRQVNRSRLDPPLSGPGAGAGHDRTANPETGLEEAVALSF
jgi:hypothetical protein